MVEKRTTVGTEPSFFMAAAIMQNTLNLYLSVKPFFPLYIHKIDSSGAVICPKALEINRVSLFSQNHTIVLILGDRAKLHLRKKKKDCTFRNSDLDRFAFG